MKLNSRTHHLTLRAAIEFERVVMARSRWKLDTDDTRVSHTRQPPTRIGARGETESSETQVMTYPYYVGIFKHFPSTIYHGQGLAWGSHTGPW